MRKGGHSCGCYLHRILDELNIQHYAFEVRVGAQEPKERAEVEWACVPEEFQLSEGCDAEQRRIKGRSSQAERLKLRDVLKDMRYGDFVRWE